MAINGKTESGTRRTWGGVASMKRSEFGSRYIRRYVHDGREYILHATKGWRSYRVTP